MVTLNSDLDHLEFQDPYFHTLGNGTESALEFLSLPSSSAKTQKADKKIVKWISSLSAEERQLLLTDTCPEFTRLLADLLRTHEQSKGKCLVAVVALEEGKLLESSQVKMYKPSGKEGAVANGGINAPVFEALLFSEIRLFSREAPLDSITVGHKLVSDVQLLMDCFRYISNGKSFENLSKERLQPRGAKKRSKSTHSVFEHFPSWFELKVGYSIYQWITAYLEHLVVTRYQVLTEGDGTLFKQQLRPFKDFFAEKGNVAKFWARVERWKVVPEMGRRLRRNVYGNFLLHAALSANPVKFVDSLYFFPLNYLCKFPCS